MSRRRRIDAPRATYPMSASMLTREISYCSRGKEGESSVASMRNASSCSLVALIRRMSHGKACLVGVVPVRKHNDRRDLHVLVVTCTRRVSQVPLQDTGAAGSHSLAFTDGSLDTTGSSSSSSVASLYLEAGVAIHVGRGHGCGHALRSSLAGVLMINIITTRVRGGMACQCHSGNIRIAKA